MDSYDWKTHYSVQLTEQEKTGEFHLAVAFREKFSITPSEYRTKSQHAGRIG